MAWSGCVRARTRVSIAPYSISNDCLCLPVSQFPKLRCLDISWNDLEICHGLDALRQLKELKAYRNRLASTGGLQECARHWLDCLGSVHSKAIVFFLHRLKLLEHLHLQGNRIARMGADFDSLRNLTFLRLDKNLLTRIEHVDRLGNLTYLDLSHNCITEAQVVCCIALIVHVLLSSVPESVDKTAHAQSCDFVMITFCRGFGTFAALKRFCLITTSLQLLEIFPRAYPCKRWSFLAITCHRSRASTRLFGYLYVPAVYPLRCFNYR